MGNYIGESPATRGFGRKGAGSVSGTSSGYTLSSAAQDFIAAERRQRDDDMAGSVPTPTQVPDALVNDIDYAIGGTDTQYVEIELDPGEAIIAENGAMIWKDPVVGFDTQVGDGTVNGLWEKVMSAGTSVISGESLFLGEFRHGGGAGKARVALGGRTPGHVLAVRLEEMGGKIVCQRGAFLAAAKGISVSVRWVGSMWTGLEGGEGFILQELSGEGWAFLHVGGTLIERVLGEGEQLHVDAGCIAAFEPAVTFDTASLNSGQIARSVKNAIVGGEGWQFARLTGPGKVWIQSLPFRRLSRTVLAEAQLPNETGLLNGGGLGLGDVVSGVGLARKLFG
ncbi:AIM24 family protein [Novosphingobium sp.]|uniref:AIM24 family protein n=1 Tax=Novosphingobium sp. TaxID=1874826 RepID=UPI0025EEB3EC|nr:AIM24 family protein [Novosphingobium sp.]